MTKHIVVLATPVAVPMICSIAYHMVDLYFLVELGVTAVAGVSAAGNAGALVVAVAQVLGAGTAALVAQALGRGDHADAKWIFHQGLALSAVCGALTGICLAILIYPYLNFVSADKSTVDAGIAFTLWALPGFVTLLPMTVLSSALRGAGVVGPAIAFYTLTVIVNIVLAPVFIAGWGTHVPLGVQGAGMATSISIILGTVLMGFYVHRSQHYLTMNWTLLWPRLQQCRRILKVGLPVGGEVALMFLVPAVILYAVRDFGAASQAGYSVGLRITQTVLVPGMSIAFAVAPIIGQNFGAAKAARVIEVFRKGMFVGLAIMVATTLFVHAASKELVGMFSASAAANDVAIIFLQVTSLAFVAQGVVYTCSSVFQGLGNTGPALISSSTCFFVFTASVVWASARPEFCIEHVWYLMVGSLTLQALLSLGLLCWELRRRL